MMVNPYDDSRLMLALQIDHSRVAGFFAAHWGNKDFARPEPYASGVLAAQEHDIGWWEWEMKPATLNEKGFPLDYHDGSLKYLGQLRLDFYKNAVDHVMQRDPYSALLMAMHGVALMNAGYGPADAFYCGKAMECASFCGEPFMGKENTQNSECETQHMRMGASESWRSTCELPHMPVRVNCRPCLCE